MKAFFGGSLTFLRHRLGKRFECDANHLTGSFGGLGRTSLFQFFSVRSVGGQGEWLSLGVDLSPVPWSIFF